MLIYIASQYSKGDQIQNIRRQIEAGDALLRMGHIPFCPLLNAFWHYVSPKSQDDWMKIDKVYLSKCDAVLRLDGPSIGANLEIRYAEKLGKPIYYSLEELKGEK